MFINRRDKRRRGSSILLLLFIGLLSAPITQSGGILCDLHCEVKSGGHSHHGSSGEGGHHNGAAKGKDTIPDSGIQLGGINSSHAPGSSSNGGSSESGANCEIRGASPDGGHDLYSSYIPLLSSSALPPYLYHSGVVPTDPYMGYTPQGTSVELPPPSSQV